MYAHLMPRAVSEPSRRSSRYLPPSPIDEIGLLELLRSTGRTAPADRQIQLLRDTGSGGDPLLFYVGHLALLQRPSVSIVGTRQVSPEGARRAAKLARHLAAADITVVSGLAKGVDTVALTNAQEGGGKVVAVIGTPLDRAYPAENATLQEAIYNDHLLLSPFQVGTRTYRSSFPKRNRVMAAISDATVIIEASDTSGTLHQAAECQQLGRWLFIAQSVVEDTSLSWPKKFLGRPKTAILSNVNDVIDAVS